MSLIEQAAKRLEELRRSGAELPEQGEPTEPSLIAEAAEAGHLGGVHARRGAPSEEHIEPIIKRIAPAAPRPASAPRRAEVNLEALRAAGFVTPDVPRSQLADEFRVMKRPIIRNALGKGGPRARNGNLVMVTSALPGEGKTFTALNLAISITLEYDTTVLLVDGDVAHPSIPGVLGTPAEPGLLDVLTRDDLDVADVLVRTNIEKLVLLPSGTPHRRATELLASEQMGSLLRELGSRYSDRIVIFDSPPLLATTEARVLASQMGQIILVVAADATSQSAVNEALSTIESCEIVLMMLNKATQSDVGTYYGYYSPSSDS
jgi:exopolysaccharide/PEP-CTERM locus tyrosine autokinase